ncbi:MAG: UDP-3-O-(3-hydroxymyristoyl)glucosamine N-acyltransferase [Hyphomicrobiaceae bacterium]|nr:UDP-3-O-(3-hydroxymyristoyl)glucosamine N-acyltransferase [Hyphomicrobiaceae bacterium]
MEHPGFYTRADPMTLGGLAGRLGATLPEGADAGLLLSDVRPLQEAGPGHLSFLDNRKYMAQLAQTQASAVLVAPAFAGRVPQSAVAMQIAQPYRAFAMALALFYPEATQPKTAMSEPGEPLVHPSARIEEGARIEAGAIVGREAQIGRGTTVAAGAVVGYRVCIGRDCYVGPSVSLTHALVGDRVILHAGVRIGQDGFGFAMGPQGHLKVPQIGRVIIQDDVEIGANSCVDRGALKDTIIGQGTKIDNLVQIGHNVVIGRNCVIVGQVGISGSVELGDFVVMGGQSGAAGHIKLGNGVQIAGASHVKDSVPAGARFGGTPAVPIREYGRQLNAMRRIGRGGDAAKDEPEDGA